jgi:two-component system chemotaxis response regulator CheY
MERSDFSSHRVLVLGGKTHTIGLLRSILSIAGVTQILHVEESHRALELLSTEHFTAVFCDHTARELDGMSFPVAARRRAGMLNPMIPIFAVQERARRRDVEKARDIGVTDVLTTPISPKTVMTKLQAALTAPRPFIVANEFFGPDRRAKARTPYYGPDRRTRVAKKAKLDFTLI